MPKLVPQTKLTKICSHAIEAFHRALGGCTFRHEKVGNGGNVTCPITSEYAIGLRPSHTTPQFQHNHEFEHTLSHEFCQKWINGNLENQRMTYLIVGVSRSTKNGSKSAKKGDLGVANLWSPLVLRFLWVRGGEFWVKKLTLPFFFKTNSCRGVLAQAS